MDVPQRRGAGVILFVLLSVHVKLFPYTSVFFFVPWPFATKYAVRMVPARSMK